jgi:hypothetical protein
MGLGSLMNSQLVFEALEPLELLAILLLAVEILDHRVRLRKLEKMGELKAGESQKFRSVKETK